MWAAAAVASGADWRHALARALGETLGQAPGGTSVDLALLFAGADYAGELDTLVRAARAGTGARYLIGCSGQGVIATGREVEGEPALALLAASLPGAELSPCYLDARAMARLGRGAAWTDVVGLAPPEVNGWLVLADPFTPGGEALIEALAAAYPGVPIAGGLASGDPARPGTHLFVADEVHAEGAVALGLGGPYRLRTIVAQGAMPIGEPWTITDVDGHVIRQIGGRPAYQVLLDTFQALSPALQRRARRNLLAGLAIDERRERFGRGDFLIRNLVGADPRTGAIALGAFPRVGQTIQFQLRDAEAATEDLRDLLTAERGALQAAQVEPVAGLLCSCNGRGQGLFGHPDHDAGLVRDRLGPVPLAGFFCNGEIGPIGGRPFLHGFTASLALIVPE